MIATPHPRTRRLTVSRRTVQRAARVLVVEDDAEMRQWVEEMLDDEGFDALTVPDGLTAIISLLVDGADVIVTDWKMPGFDGLRLLDSTRRLAPRTPVVFVTAYAEATLHEQVLKLGAFSLLEKPFRRDDLLLHVKNALRLGAVGSS